MAHDRYLAPAAPGPSPMSLILHSPFDAHLHLRDGAMLELVAPLTTATFAGAVIMPNLVPPVDSLERLRGYRERIAAATPAGHAFQPGMTLFFRDYSEAELAEAKPEILGIKLYPAGATTNSEAGVAEISRAEPTLRRMEEQDIPLLVHGETHGFVLDREREFCAIYRELATRFPRLRITMEHITTAEAVAVLDEFPNLRASVTLQHLLADLDALIGGLLKPHWFCKPVLKRPEDHEALLACALSGHPRLMFGSDSAPHPRDKKESCGCAAGCFTAPQALAKLAELFDSHGELPRLQAFVSDHAVALYHLDLPPRQVVLAKASQVVPARYAGDGVETIPLLAGEEIGWRVIGGG